jgi:hypothetical protein
VSHGALEDEAQDRGLAEVWSPGKEAAPWHSEDAKDPEEWFLKAWRVAEAVDEAEDADVAARALAKKLTETTERSSKPSAMRWRRAMIDLLEEFDAIVRKTDTKAVLPSSAILVSLVTTEPQLSRPADRMVELVALEQNAIGFRHKQDGGLFHFRFATPGKQRRDMAEMQAELRKSKTEAFLDNYRVAYSVEVRPKS